MSDKITVDDIMEIVYDTMNGHCTKYDDYYDGYLVDWKGSYHYGEHLRECLVEYFKEGQHERKDDDD